MPEVDLVNLHNYKNAKMNLADFEAKLIIIDFWATWCSPCVAMIPKMDSLQKEFKNDVQFISVSYQSEKEVTTFMQQLEKQSNTKHSIPYVADDNVLRLMFPHKTLPHYVWISANGTVKAITGADEITSVNIDKMLSSDISSLPVKNDISIPYNEKKPLLINGNGGDGSTLIAHSILSGYIEGLPGAMNFERADNVNINRITVTNSTILWLFKIAYGDGLTTFFPQNRVLLEVAHPKELFSGLSGNDYLQWLSKPGHGICYDVSLPSDKSHLLYSLFRQNIKILFPQYTARVENRKVKCIALVRLPGADKIASADLSNKVIENIDGFGVSLQNSTLSALVNTIQMKLGQTSPMPVVDETAYNGKVSLKFSADLSSIADMNRALKPYNLAWQERMIPLEMLVVSDTNKIN